MSRLLREGGFAPASSVVSRLDLHNTYCAFCWHDAASGWLHVASQSLVCTWCLRDPDADDGAVGRSERASLGARGRDDLVRVVRVDDHVVTGTARLRAMRLLGEPVLAPPGRDGVVLTVAPTLPCPASSCRLHRNSYGEHVGAWCRVACWQSFPTSPLGTGGRCPGGAAPHHLSHSNRSRSGRPLVGGMPSSRRKVRPPQWAYPLIFGPDLAMGERAAKSPLGLDRGPGAPLPQLCGL